MFEVSTVTGYRSNTVVKCGLLIDEAKAYVIYEFGLNALLGRGVMNVSSLRPVAQLHFIGEVCCV